MISKLQRLGMAVRKPQKILGLEWPIDIGVLIIIGVIFVILDWRLFAIGSKDQLFLYGDNLVFLNHLHYLFRNFSILDPFNTFISQNGMMGGGYPMSEPQNSIFYPPTFLLMILYNIFQLGPKGLYYLLLGSYSAHTIVGSFIVYLICRKRLSLTPWLALIGGIIYLGAGWNVVSFGTGTLSYMVGALPLVFYIFLGYLKKPSRKTLLVFVGSLAFFLFAGGIINFFIYLWVNLFLFLLAKHLFLDANRQPIKYLVNDFAKLLILAPIWAIAIYSIQLISSFVIAKDIMHGIASYDYLAFFGTQAADLIGLIFPQFGLLGFGITTDPVQIYQFHRASALYIGLLPLTLAIIGGAYLKSKAMRVMLGFAAFNLLLALGGLFVLYDISYLIPGTKLFRGNYKYLAFFSLFVSLAVPLILSRINELKDHIASIFQKLWRIILVLAFVAVLVGIITFVIIGTDAKNTSQFEVLRSISNYLFRALIIMVATAFAIKLYIESKTKLAIVFLGLVLVLDFSASYKYQSLYQFKLSNLFSKDFFECCQNKSVLNDIPEYSQTYHIPEVLNVDIVPVYAAIPNRYLTEYSWIIKSHQHLAYRLLQSAGMDGVLTTKVMDESDFKIGWEKAITEANYGNIFVYKASGSILNSWGADRNLVGQKVTYYEVENPQKTILISRYVHTNNESDAMNYLKSPSFDPGIPVIINAPKPDNFDDKPPTNQSRLVDLPTYKKIVVTKGQKGMLYVNEAYSRIWRAKVNGVVTPIYRANYAFMAVPLAEEGEARVELYVDERPLNVGMAISLLSLSALVAGLYGSWRKIF